MLSILLSLNACSSKTCTLVGGIPMVSVDTSALTIDDPATTEVCLDDRCVAMGDAEVLGPEPDGSITVIDVKGDESERTIVVRTIDGEVLAGPSVVEIPTIYPNGEGCPGEALQGRFSVGADGEIEASS